MLRRLALVAVLAVALIAMSGCSEPRSDPRRRRDVRADGAGPRSRDHGR